MPIHVPGYRTARKKHVSVAKRNVVAVLSLTAMVDMFTVLAVFLLQNYRTTGEVIEIKDNVVLPNATSVKELLPSNVVTISTEDVTLNEVSVADYNSIKAQQDWLVARLEVEVKKLIEDGEREKQTIANRIKQAVADVKPGEDTKPEVVDKFRKITIQADKDVDFATLKKIMYTVTEAGIYEINFAVIKKETQKDPGI
jgi:biopolymer transport protein ExbD